MSSGWGPPIEDDDSGLGTGGGGVVGTGTLNADNIITATLNAAGNPLVMYDLVSGLYFAVGPMVVTDLLGNVVST